MRSYECTSESLTSLVQAVVSRTFPVNLEREVEHGEGALSPPFRQHSPKNLARQFTNSFSTSGKTPEERRLIAEEMERDLGVLRTTLQPSELLKEALPDRFLERGLRVDKIMETWRHGERLLDLCIHFLGN